MHLNGKLAFVRRHRRAVLEYTLFVSLDREAIIPMAHVNGGDEDVEARLNGARELPATSKTGNIDLPFEERTEAKTADLRRQIALYQSILDRRHFSN